MSLVRTTLIAVFVVLWSQSVLAVKPINTTWVGNLAVEGYDPVAYFTENRAIKGKKAFELEWNGANWRFSSEENLNLFTADPERYAPQYGGYCAFAVSNNTTASIDPKQFAIVDNKLYLNYSARIQKLWLPEKEERIELADENWPGLVE